MAALRDKLRDMEVEVNGEMVDWDDVAYDCGHTPTQLSRLNSQALALHNRVARAMPMWQWGWCRRSLRERHRLIATGTEVRHLNPLRTG